MSSFSSTLTVKAVLKVPGTFVDGKRAENAESVTIRCTPLTPIPVNDRENMLLRQQLNTPLKLFDTYVPGTIEVSEGYILTVSAVDYPVRAIESWPWRGTETYKRLILEEAKQ
jgi:hypothetical protein